MVNYSAHDLAFATLADPTHRAILARGTELTFTHAGLFSEVSEKSHAGGWTGAFDKLVRVLEKTRRTNGGPHLGEADKP